MVTEAKPKRIPSRRALEIIDEGLEEIRLQFGWGRPDSAASALRDGGRDLDEDQIEEDIESFDEDEDGEGEDGYFDREAVEVAIDAFISTLLDSDVIRKTKSGKLPSFGTIFARLFGDKGDVVDLASAFEDDIKGYMGWISPDHMRSAEERFMKIRELVHDMLKDQAHGH